MNILKFRWYLYGLAFTAGVSGAALLYHKGYGHYLLALSGDPARQYEYGRWLAERDFKKDALTWISLAADRNETHAMVWLGLAYQGGGYFMYPNMENSLHYLKSAAERNNPEGMHGYASLFEAWEGLRKQYPAESNAGAFVWYSNAADKGLAIAMERMIRIYEKGEFGVAVSQEDADIWRNKLQQSHDRDVTPLRERYGFQRLRSSQEIIDAAKARMQLK